VKLRDSQELTFPIAQRVEVYWAVLRRRRISQ
jgi:hypothetical protein